MAKKSDVVLTQDIKAVRKLCKQVKGCWIPPGSGRLPCRAERDERPDADLPTIAPHRWVWVVLHGFSSDPGPGIHVRRVCSTKRCCNPEHLYATTADGRKLTKREFKRCMRLKEESDSPPEEITRQPVVRNLSQLRSICSIDKKRGCWIPANSGRLAVRAKHDKPSLADVPSYAPHRGAYVLKYAPERALAPSVHIRRRCATKRCCNPDHLFAATPDGKELSPEAALIANVVQVPPGESYAGDSSYVASETDNYLMQVFLG